MASHPDKGIEPSIENVPLTIEDALEIAIAKGRMTIGEAEECREAYYETFQQASEDTSN